MKIYLVVGFLSIYGLVLRMTFGAMNNVLEVMGLSFLAVAPFAIGYATVYLANREYVNSNVKAFFLPWLTSLAILAITILLSLEGAICWVMIYPLFAVFSGVGGVVAYKRKKPIQGEEGILDDDFINKRHVALILLAPAFFGLIEGDRSLNKKYVTVYHTIEIPASTNKVWEELTNINTIASKEAKFSFTTLLGFPRHIETTLDTLKVGGKRKAIYERGLYFDETIVAFEPEKWLVLDIQTDPYNIPPTVMDEHILIGGKHIDILQDVYQIQEISNDSCQVTLSTKFFINTPFNWYSNLWAKYLMLDIQKGTLGLIKNRASNK